ncbi:MAG: 4'-phosphopantetheinyl transferase superfamily protein [Chloroflexota bacterium]
MTISNCTWHEAPTHPVLSSSEVHVWCASLEQPVTMFDGSLSIDERARAQRFRFEKDRDRFIVGRGLLRYILGLYLDYPPEAIQFMYGLHGKPGLINELNPKKLCFNLAHSGDLILFGVTQDRAIGIDVERIQSISNVQELVGQYFSPMEIDEYTALSSESKLDAFYSGWTRKEAYVKARGEGLSIPLDQFSVSMIPGKSDIMMKFVNQQGVVLPDWSVLSIDPDPAPGYVGALVVHGDDWKLVKWRMPNIY